MKQLEIEFFWPLTEQIPLDLDYTDCDSPKYYWTDAITNNSVLMSNGSIGATSWNVPQTLAFTPSFNLVGYWKVGEGLQMHNKKKPSWLHQQMTKIFFGWEWQDK
jgi:hypothetical protein